MDADRYPLHHRSQIDVQASADSLFARLDDHARLAGHCETRGKPRLLVIGAYRMGFTIAPIASGSRLVASIDYALPPRGICHLLGLLFGEIYAAWCTRRMSTDAAREFAGMTTA